MLIAFATDDLRDICNDIKAAKKAYGADGVKKLRRRLDDLAAAPNLEAVRNLPGRCHELKGDLAGSLGIDLDGGRRLVIRPTSIPAPTKDDGGLDWTKVTRITVTAIKDYHD